MLQAGAVNGNKVFLCTHKTGVPVHVPIPDFVANEPASIRPAGGCLFLRGESTRLETRTDLWCRQVVRCSRPRRSPTHIHTDSETPLRWSCYWRVFPSSRYRAAGTLAREDHREALPEYARIVIVFRHFRQFASLCHAPSAGLAAQLCKLAVTIKMRWVIWRSSFSEVC
jgi:hypothetical protein